MKLNLGGSPTSDNRQTRSAKGGKRSLRSSRLLTFVFFLGVAFVFWFLQRLQGDFVRPISIPLSYDSVALNSALASELPQKIDLMVQDKGFEHLRYSLEGMEPIELKVYREGTHGEYVGLKPGELKAQLEQRLSSSAQILQQSPQSIRTRLFARVSKRLPLRLEYEPSTAAGFTSSDIALSPDSLIVFGTRESLDTLSYINVATPRLAPLSESLDTAAEVLLPRGISSRSRSVRLQIVVEELTEQSFTLPIQARGAPQGYALRPLPGTVTVLLTLPRSRYTDLVESDLEVSIDYRDLENQRDEYEASSVRQLPVELSKRPHWVKRYSLNPETVQFVLEQIE